MNWTIAGPEECRLVFQGWECRTRYLNAQGLFLLDDLEEHGKTVQLEIRES